MRFSFDRDTFVVRTPNLLARRIDNICRFRWIALAPDRGPIEMISPVNARLNDLYGPNSSELNGIGMFVGNVCCSMRL